MSSKEQVTTPVGLVCELEFKPGTKRWIVPVQDGLMLLKQAVPMADTLAGSTGGVYGDPDEYVRGERASWS